MRYLCFHKSAKPEDIPPTQEEMATMGALIEESFKSGILLAAEGCLPSAFGVRVGLKDGSYSVTDGPFTEAKEIVGGMAIINVKSKEEAIEFTKRFLSVAGDGVTEVRQLYDDSAVDTATKSA